MYVYVCESWWRVSPTRNVWAHGSWTYTLSCIYKHIQYIFILVWLHTCLRMSCSACIYVQFWGWINQVGPTNRPGLPWLQGGPNPCSTPASSAWTPARVNHQLFSAGGIYSVSLSDLYIYIWRLFWDSISHLAYQLAFYLASYLTYTQTLWHFVWHIFWHFIWHSVWLSDIYFDILHDLLSDTYSDIHFDILNLALHLAFGASGAQSEGSPLMAPTHNLPTCINPTCSPTQNQFPLYFEFHDIDLIWLARYSTIHLDTDLGWLIWESLYKEIHYTKSGKLMICLPKHMQSFRQGNYLVTNVVKHHNNDVQSKYS